MSRVPHRRTACALLAATAAALILRLPTAGAALINRPGAFLANSNHDPVLTSIPSWSGTPLRPRLTTERTVIKNPRQGRGQQVPKGGGLLDEVARWDAEGGSGEHDLDLLVAMSKHRHGDEASARPADDGRQCEGKDAPSIPRPGLRAISRAESRLHRPLRAPPDRALDGLEGLTADELRSLADMTQRGPGSELAAGARAAEQVDAAGSEVSSAHAGDGLAGPPAKTPPEMMRVEMLRRENSFLRMQLKQLGQQAHGRQDHDHSSSAADESQDESRGAADPPMGSDHAMKMMDEQLRRLPGSHPAWPQRHERAHKRRRSASHPGWLPPTLSPTRMRACTGGLGGLLQRRRRDGRLAVIPGVGDVWSAATSTALGFQGVLLGEAFLCARLAIQDSSMASLGDLRSAVADMSGACAPRSLLVESSSAFGEPKLTFLAARTLSDMGVGGVLLGDAVGGAWGRVRAGAARVKAGTEMLHCVRAAKAASQHEVGAESDGQFLVLVRTLVTHNERGEAQRHQVRDGGEAERAEKEELQRLRAAIACGADGVVVDVSGSCDDRVVRVQRLCSQLQPSSCGGVEKGASTHTTGAQARLTGVDSGRGAMVLVRMAAGVRVLSVVEQAKLASAGVCGVLRPDDVSLRAAAAAWACLRSLVPEEGRSPEELAADSGAESLDAGGGREGGEGERWSFISREPEDGEHPCSPDTGSNCAEGTLRMGAQAFSHSPAPTHAGDARGGGGNCGHHEETPRAEAREAKGVLDAEEMQRLAAGARNGLQLVEELHLE